MRILLAEDDPVLRCLLEELLVRWGHDILVAEDGGSAVAFARKGERFDVAILDWMMPEVSGPDVCRAIREACVERRPFVLMLTAKSQLEDVVSGLDAGADEYLTKPYRPAELAARLRAADRLMKMQDDLIEARRLVAYQATHDLVTGLWNRATFLEKLHATLLERQGAPSPLSIVRVDFGGKGGARARLDDELLKGVAQRVSEIVGPGAVVGRTAESEILVLLPQADEPEGEREAMALSDGFRAAPFATPVGPVVIAIDAGVVTAHTFAELDLAWLLCALDSLGGGGGGVGQFSFELAS